MDTTDIDDILLTGNTQETIEKLKHEFKAKNLGELNKFLGMEIKREGNTLKITQEEYIDKILKRFNMTDCKGKKTPMEVKFQIETTRKEIIKQPYRELIGSLLYIATISRPDIAFAVSYLSRKLETPTKTEWEAGKRIVRYLKETKKASLIFEKNGEKNDLMAYTDADWAGDRTDRKSTSGMIVFWGRNLISWGTTKQNCVGLSTAESEYIAAARAAQEIGYLKGILQNFNEWSVLLTDNQSALKVCLNYENIKRSKHIVYTLKSISLIGFNKNKSVFDRLCSYKRKFSRRVN